MLVNTAMKCDCQVLEVSSHSLSGVCSISPCSPLSPSLPLPLPISLTPSFLAFSPLSSSLPPSLLSFRPLSLHLSLPLSLCLFLSMPLSLSLRPSPSLPLCFFPPFLPPSLPLPSLPCLHPSLLLPYYIIFSETCLRYSVSILFGPYLFPEVQTPSHSSV